MEQPLKDFTPVPVRYRHDGWTAERQIAFIEALAETACVEESCRRVGKSHVSAYRLRRHRDGGLFRAAWDAALDYALHRLEQAAIGRAINGVARPIFFKGEQVGEYREYDERLTMFLLHSRRRARFGAWLERQPADAIPAGDDEVDRLHDLIEEIEEFADVIDREAGEDPDAPRA
jgi:hypothetical protein